MISSYRAIVLSFVSFFSLFCATLYAQGEMAPIRDVELKKVKTLFENDMYHSVIKEVNSIQGQYHSITPHVEMELETYKLLSAIRLGYPNVDALVWGYKERYPYSHHLSVVGFYYSSLFFEREEYTKALSIIKGVEAKHLSQEQRWEFLFNKAYCSMRVGENDVAKVAFKQVLALGNTPYLASSSYYIGYLEYLSNNFKEAVAIFKTLEKNNEYSLLSGYFSAESYFMMKEYKEAIKYGERVYDKLEGDFKLKCARLLSHSFYELGDKRGAKRYLDLYSDKNEGLSRKDNYYMGVVSYSLQAYYSAIDAFSKVVVERDSIAQNGYLYLGNSYLEIKNKLGAYNAFKEAAYMDFDHTIKQEAFFLYAKLAFDLNSDIIPFTTYLSLYPSSKRGDEIYNYIATAYLLNRNYEDALGALKNISQLNPQMTLNYQKAAFFRAMQLLDMSSYRSAIDNFDISIEKGIYNQPLATLSKFWLSEAYYRLNEYSKVIKILEPIVNSGEFGKFDEYPLALVNIGYSYFHQSNYNLALEWFEKYLKLPPSKRNMTLEIRTRVGDCYYMNSDYERAAEMYEEVALKTFSTDDVYPLYMGALAFGLSSKPQKKISMLRTIIDDKYHSDYYHISLYELGRTYTQEGNDKFAIECFNTLLRDARDSTYHTKSLLELGMIHSNMLKYGEALEYFTTIVEKYPLSNDAQNALVGIETIYQLQNDPQGYLAYLERVGMSSIKSEDEKELMFFTAAEQLFLSGRYDKAVESLLTFIKDYPEGAKLSQAYFYLGESYSKIEKPEFAADAYLKVMQTGQGAFVELATLYYALIELRLEHFETGCYAFENLYEIAQFENNKKEALVGMMRCYFGMKNYQKTISTAQTLLGSGVKDDNLLREANYKIAKSYHSMGDRDNSYPIFEQLAGSPSSAEGGESAYYLVLNSYEEGNFEKVEDLVYKYADSGSFPAYWLAKCFIVLGDSFAEREEWEQAKATFSSIQEGYFPSREHDDILEQVQMRLSKIEENEQK